ncbi:MAG: hypothetical protein JXA97_07950 [Anaerolineales bacterium]|nr:hypothetical protein [Anaerolineales bacterium]
MFEFDQAQIIRLLGLGFIGAGLVARFGTWRKWFWKTRKAPYGYVPLGLLFILYTYSDLAEERLGSNYFLYLIAFGILGICVVWFSQRPMEFLKPRWVRWLEALPPRILIIMEQRVDDGDEWESHLVSEEAVNAWAQSLKGKTQRRK